MLALILAILLLLLNYFFCKETFSNYDTLKSEWSSIFPDGNRNAAGPVFFKYILDKKLTFDEFKELNRYYCAVSGSLVSPDAASHRIYLPDVDTNDLICGNYYTCCWPCLCDIMKYAKTKKVNLEFKDTTKDVYLIVINNPCLKPDFPEEVNKEYFCEGSKLNNDKVYSLGDLLVIGLFHDAETCTDSKKELIDNDPITGERCQERNSKDLDDIQGGMGDIFIKLAK